jgi:hypothetical protein
VPTVLSILENSVSRGLFEQIIGETDFFKPVLRLHDHFDKSLVNLGDLIV